MVKWSVNTLTNHAFFLFATRSTWKSMLLLRMFSRRKSRDRSYVEKTGEVVAICETKSTDKVDERHANNLNLFGKDFPKARRLLVSNGPQIIKFGEATALYWKDALNELQNLMS